MIVYSLLWNFIAISSNDMLCYIFLCFVFCTLHVSLTIIFVLAYTLVLIVNIIASGVYFFHTVGDSGIKNSSGSTLGVSILLFVLYTPMSYLCWFRTVYKAFRYNMFLRHHISPYCTLVNFEI